MAIDKSNWDMKIKVSQSTINQIKKMGMSKALGIVGDYSHPSVANLPGNKEIVEGIKRLYGNRALNAISKSGMTGPKSANTKATYVNKTGGPKSARTK